MRRTRRESHPIIAIILFGSAITLFALAVLIYNGVVPLGPEVRVTAAVIVGAAACGDLLIAMWFFRKSQSGAPSTRSVRDGVESGAPSTRSVRDGVESS
jgi:hypothetical protein